MDADLQDNPEVIKQMYEKWREGFDHVVGVRSSRKTDTRLKRYTANGFYRLMSRLGEVPLTANAGDFRLLDRKVVDALGLIRERTRFMKGIFSWLGFRQAVVRYDRTKREAGKSKWGYWKLWNFALEGITSFTSLPLIVWTYIGLALAVTAFLYAVFIVLKTLIFGIDVPGYASIIVFILFFSGVNLISIGIIREHLARVYLEVKRRPLYLIRDKYGFQPEDASD